MYIANLPKGNIFSELNSVQFLLICVICLLEIKQSHLSYFSFISFASKRFLEIYFYLKSHFISNPGSLSFVI